MTDKESDDSGLYMQVKPGAFCSTRPASGCMLSCKFICMQIHLPVVRTWSTKCGMFGCEIEEESDYSIFVGCD
ncbi:MAG: hypothetical protein K6G65_02920 [Lachnospiraceae bacterium]|nr:hypothetical protein [Lachnospiraceae bacterium]